MIPHVFDRILSLAEAEQMTGFSASRLRQLIDEGRMPAKKVGKTWLVLREDVQAVASHVRRPGRPIVPLHGNWALEDLDRDRQDWLLYKTASVLAEPVDGDAAYRLIFIPISGEAFAYELPAGLRDLSEHWRWLTLALEDWAAAVESARGFVVHREWDPAQPPTERAQVAEVDPDHRVRRWRRAQKVAVSR